MVFVSDALKVWCVKRLMCTNISLCMWPGVIGFLEDVSLEGWRWQLWAFFWFKADSYRNPVLNCLEHKKKWILLAPNSQIIFRTMQWFLCVCFVSAFRECKISFRYHEFSEEKVKRWTARGIQNQDRVFWRLKSWLCCWKVRKCMKMLWRNDLLPETIEMKVDFCVKLTTKSTKADAKDQDQCSEIHRITW